ncbi:MAG: glycosyltransferase family 4 protein [Desulfobacterales bacterium]|nr:glycosyltransferase family 4 protein [Desulfobacterales bacterium]
MESPLAYEYGVNNHTLPERRKIYRAVSGFFNMKIIYLHQYFNTPQMFGGTRSYEMARRFVAAGHEVHMITSSRERNNNASGCLEEIIDGIHVHWLSVSYSNKMDFKARILAFLKFAVASGVKAYKVGGDVIFATSTPLTIALPAVYAARRLKKPMVFEVRDLWPELPIAVGALKNPFLKKAAKWLERFAYQNSAEIIALSPGMKDGIIRTGYPAEHVHVIPNSCDLKLFQVPLESGIAFRKRFPLINDRPLVIYAGTFGRINGVGYIVRLAAEMQKLSPETCFLVIGDGYEFEMVANFARDLGVLDQNFFMMSQLSKAEMPALFSAATITISTVIDLPQMGSNSANKFFDSLAAGRPVAINYEGWQAEILRKSGAGIVLPANDIYKAARRLKQAISDKDWCSRAATEALKLARTQFDRDHLAKKLEAVLVSAVSNFKK